MKRKWGEFDKCKVRLVVQGQHMRRKGEDGVSDYNDAFSPAPADSGFHTILSLATQQNMFTDHVDISQAFVQGELLPRDSHNSKFIFLHRQDMTKILSTCIASSSLFMECPLQQELDTPPRALSLQKKDVPQWNLKRTCGPSRLTALVSS